MYLRCLFSRSIPVSPRQFGPTVTSSLTLTHSKNKREQTQTKQPNPTPKQRIGSSTHTKASHRKQHGVCMLSCGSFLFSTGPWVGPSRTHPPPNQHRQSHSHMEYTACSCYVTQITHTHTPCPFYSTFSFLAHLYCISVWLIFFAAT